MPVAPTEKRIDELMERASDALASTSYFEAEQLALEALAAARKAEDFERMARIVLPLQEARRQRFQQALDVGTITILDEERVEEGMHIEPGCYLIQPPQVGADARRLRLMALQQQIPVGVLCREPMTILKLRPIVAIGACGSLRTRVPPAADPDKPDLAWFANSLEDLGDAAIETIDSGHEASRRVDAILERLDAVPEHERLHQLLEETCKEAHRAQIEAADSPKRKRR